LNNNLPLVSVIIPTYRRSEFLVRAIRSVVNQTYKNIEIIVVDDNDAEDSFHLDTKQKMEEFAHRVHYIKHDENKGVVQARNTGILEAKGEYIAFLDDDDEWLVHKIELQVDLLNALPDDYGLVYCGYKVISEGDFEQIIKPKFRGDLSQVLGLNHIGSPSLVLCKKEYVKLVGGFDDRIVYREDLDFFYKLSRICQFDFVKAPLVNYYLHEGSKSKNSHLRLEGMISFLNLYSGELKGNKVRWSEIMERLGELQIINGLQFRSFLSFLEAYFHRPTRISILAKLLLSFLGPSNYKKIRKL
jgi:glycosyltransferase involved in cell wall biosynthesis